MTSINKEMKESGIQETQGMNDKMLENTAWGMLFILWGVSIFFDAIPFGAAIAGSGLILLGLNGMRAANRIPTRGLATVFGVLGLVWGGLELLPLVVRLRFQMNDWAIFSILLVVVGAIFLRVALHQARRDGSVDAG